MKSSLLFIFCCSLFFPSHASKDSKCRIVFHGDYYSRHDFILFLIDSEAYSTEDFLKLKSEGLPEGVPEDPLLVYTSFRGSWKNLWKRVNKIRIQKEREKQVLALAAKNNKITTKDIANTTGLTIDSIYSIIRQLTKTKQLVYNSIQDFILFLIDAENNSTDDFIKLRNKGLLPVGMPDKPLQIYLTLRRNWDNLWRRVNKTRIQKEREQQVLALIEKNKTITAKEIMTKTNLTRDIVYYIIEQLRNEGLLVYVGQQWIILQKGDKSPPDPLEERKQQVLALIEKNKTITTKEIAKKTGFTQDVVFYITEKLEDEGLLVYIGHPPWGEWEILEKGAKPSPDPAKERKRQVLALIKKHRRITAKQIALETGLDINTVYEITRQLKNENWVVHVGPKNGGFLEPLEKGKKTSPNPIEERKKQILNLIEEFEGIRAKEIAEKIAAETKQEIKPDINTVYNTIEQLKKEKRLIRVGGHWKIVEEAAEPSDELPDKPINRLFAGSFFQPSTEFLDDPLSVLQKEWILALILTNKNISLEQIAYMMDLPEEIIQQIIEELRWEIQDTLKQIKEQILILIKRNKEITISQMTEIIQVPRLLIRKLIEQLKREKTLLWKNGYWKILKKEAQPLDEILTGLSVQPSIETLNRPSSYLIEQHKTEVLILILSRENISVEQIARIKSVSDKVIQEIIKKLRWELQDILKKTKEQILTLIAENDKISISKIAETIRTPILVVRKLVEQLQKERVLFGKDRDWTIPEGNPEN